MKNLLRMGVVFWLFAGTQVVYAQEKSKSLYAEFGFGFGQTLFFGDTKQKVGNALGASFDPGVVSNLFMSFYYTPQKLKGFGIGGRIKGSIAGPVREGNDDFFFNYYTFGPTIKYYPFSKQFNKGSYTRLTVGSGQLTTKRANEESNNYTHQFAVGGIVMGGIGYTFLIANKTFSIESEFEFSNRNGTVQGIGDDTFQSGQLGVNLIYSF